MKSSAACLNGRWWRSPGLSERGSPLTLAAREETVKVGSSGEKRDFTRNRDWPCCSAPGRSARLVGARERNGLGPWSCAQPKNLAGDPKSSGSMDPHHEPPGEKDWPASSSSTPQPLSSAQKRQTLIGRHDWCLGTDVMSEKHQTCNTIYILEVIFTSTQFFRVIILHCCVVLLFLPLQSDQQLTDSLPASRGSKPSALKGALFVSWGDVTGTNLCLQQPWFLCMQRAHSLCSFIEFSSLIFVLCCSYSALQKWAKQSTSTFLKRPPH